MALIQWKTLAGQKKVYVLETMPKGATRLLLRGPGKCKVQGSAARDANGNWNPVQISRSYKVRDGTFQGSSAMYPNAG